ncbi:MAG: phosphoserine phosphatase SerB [Marinicaulis sp.]|nr:phosphoserine phosphatase SerB [Marinicaulis sp.]
MASALTISPPISCASFKARPDLPLAVGPAIKMILLFFLSGIGMFHTVATLICNPNDPQFDNELAGKLSCHLDHEDFGSPTRRVLSSRSAEEYLFHLDRQYIAKLHNELRTYLKNKPVDIHVQPIAGRRKRLLIADMDSTIIEQECIDELAEYAGKRAEISDITERAMRGELDFEAALKERVAMLKGLPESVLQETFDKRITLTPGAKTLVQTMNKLGAVTALVSGGFTFFTSRVAAACGFQIDQANELIIENGVLTGEVKMPILGRQAKEDALRRIAAENGIDLNETIAVGDGANDLSMLEAAGLGVAFFAKPAVAEMADARIDHSDLTALLFFQGIAQSEFAD